MTNYLAKFSNGTTYQTSTKRPTAFAWRVEFKRGEGVDHTGGFSADAKNAEKAMSQSLARIEKWTTATFSEVAPADKV